jgi:hypothetical protein
MPLSCRPRVLALAIAAVFVAGSGAALEARPQPPGLVVAAGDAPAVVVPDPTLPPAAVAPPAPAAVVPTPPPTTAVPPPPPPTTVAPAPPPPPVPAPAPAPAFAGPLERAQGALVEAVPARWRDALPVTVSIIEGQSSWANSNMELRIGRYHAEGRWSHLVSVVGHEFGHIIAFRYGSQAFAGAAPVGWPDPGHGPPEEAWADCVSLAFTGIVDPSYGMPPCPQNSLQWTANWLAAGPP